MRGGEELDLSTTPSIILVIGVNGVGKTTTIGNLQITLQNRAKKLSLPQAIHSEPQLSSSLKFGQTEVTVK